MGQRRRFLLRFLVATAVVVAVMPVRGFPQATKPPASLMKVNLGWQPTMNGARYFVAQANRLFEQAGLDPALIKFTAGPPFFSPTRLYFEPWHGHSNHCEVAHDGTRQPRWGQVWYTTVIPASSELSTGWL